MRGHEFRGVRDFVPGVDPLLAGGLDRALAMAEALEARGFGATGDDGKRRRTRWNELAFGTGMVGGLGGLAVAVYCLAVGLAGWAAAAAVVGGSALAAVVGMSPAPSASRTRYRLLQWTAGDTLVTMAACVVVAVVLVRNAGDPGSLAYSTYPELGPPPVDLPLLLALGLLMAPAVVFRPKAQPA